MAHPEFGPIGILSALTLLLPLPWHWRAGNVATLSIILWLFVINMIYGIDAIIWARNVDIVATVWCDITTKLIIGANTALPAACFCISVHLEEVASVRNVRSTLSDKRRRQIIEGCMCYILPMIIMALHYVVQGHRFDIIEDYGCRPATYYSIAAIFIVYVPPLVLAMGALVFSALALRHFIIRRMTFAQHLATSNSALTTSRYLRLILMSAVQMIWSLSGSAYTLWFTATFVPIRPWTNWADVHSDFSRIDLFLTILTPPAIVHTYLVLWWFIPASTILFVAFFSFGRDAMDEYKKCFEWIRVHVFRRRPANVNKNIPLTASNILASSKPTVQLGRSIEVTQSVGSPTDSSMLKCRSSLDDIEIGSHSECDVPGLHYGSIDGKAIGSFTDLTPETPSTIAPSSPAAAVSMAKPALSMFPSYVTLSPFPTPRSPQTTPGSPRPLTYPSHDATFRGINPPNPDNV